MISMLLTSSAELERVVFVLLVGIKERRGKKGRKKFRRRVIVLVWSHVTLRKHQDRGRTLIPFLSPCSSSLQRYLSRLRRRSMICSIRSTEFLYRSCPTCKHLWPPLWRPLWRPLWPRPLDFLLQNKMEADPFYAF